MPGQYQPTIDSLRRAAAEAAEAGVGAIDLFGVPAAAMLGICASAMAVSVVCDLRARVIPLEACGLVAVAGTAFQLLACGPAGAAAGLGTALFVAAGSALANRLLGGRCPWRRAPAPCAGSRPAIRLRASQPWPGVRWGS